MSLKSLYYKLIDHKWLLGFPQNDLKGIVSGESMKVQWVKGCPDDRWFADPFVLAVSDTIIELLVEEYVYAIKKGRIAKLTIDRKTFELLRNDLVLELDTHLSFPAIIRKEGHIYIYPENSGANNLSLYEYDVRLNKCELVQKWIDEPLADAICTSAFGERILLATVVPNQNKNMLWAYHYNDATSKFERLYEVKFDENIARNTGDLFRVGNEWYRAAQDCNKAYGKGLSFQKVFMSEDRKLKFKEVCRAYSPNPRYEIGMHTFNTYQGISVIDVKGYKHPLIGRFVAWVRNLKP